MVLGKLNLLEKFRQTKSKEILKRLEVKLRPMERREVLTFGEENKEPFHLVSVLDEQKKLHRSLSQGPLSIKMLGPALDLLRYLVVRSGRVVFRSDIVNALWPNGSSPDIVTTYVGFLREAKALNDQVKPYRFIETHSKHGYKFILPVQRDGDLDDVQAFTSWRPEHFYKLLSQVDRGSDVENEDLRISTTAFNSSVSEMGLKRLLRNDVRISILMIDPRNEILFEARHGLRKDKSIRRLKRELHEQIAEIKDLVEQYPRKDPHEPRGSIELRFSNRMPCGLVAHSRNWALLGIFPAHDSYLAGPMLEISSGSELWQELAKDWHARWTDQK